MQQYLQNKKGLVQSVFDSVYDKYDLMNDFMSLGVHRIWKKNLIQLMNPSKGKKMIDVAANAGAVIDGIIVQTVVGAAATTCTIYKNSAIAGNRMIDPVNTAAGSGPVFAAFDAANPSANNIGSSDSILIVTSGAVQVTVLFLCSSSGFNKNVTVT